MPAENPYHDRQPQDVLPGDTLHHRGVDRVVVATGSHLDTAAQAGVYRITLDSGITIEARHGELQRIAVPTCPACGTHRQAADGVFLPHYSSPREHSGPYCTGSGQQVPGQEPITEPGATIPVTPQNRHPFRIGKDAKIRASVGYRGGSTGTFTEFTRNGRWATVRFPDDHTCSYSVTDLAGVVRNDVVPA